MCILCSLAGKGSGGLGCLDAAAAPTGDGTGSGNAPGSTTDVVETSDAAAGTTTAYSLSSGQSVQGRIASLGDSDWYKVTLVAGHTYTFAVAGEGATSNNLHDPYLRLRDSAGTQVPNAFDDDSGPGLYSSLSYTAAATGTYYVDVQAWNNASTGRYGMSVTEAARASYDIEMGAGALLVPNLSWSASPGTAATVTYGFRQTTNGDAPNFSPLSATQITTVQTILQFWSEVAGITFTQVNPGGTTNNATILFANYNSTTDGAGAYAYYPGSTASAADAGDVWLNTNSVSTTSLPFGSYSFFAIMHEVGHTLGLAHPGDYNAAPGQSITYANNAQFTQDTQQYTVMSYFDETNTGAQYLGYADTPMLFDVYALQQLYGANMSTRTGNTVYGFNTNAGAVFNFSTNSHPAFTIWDAGGTDTLDASGYSQDQTINLNAGTYSSVGGLNSNIAIAVGAMIENAIGGSGNDTIIGNAAGNTLRGNGGNDTIDGAGGIDSVAFSGARGSYTLTDLGNGSMRVSGSDGVDTLTNIELLVFSDQTVIWPLTEAGDLAVTNLVLTGVTLSYTINNLGTGTAVASMTGIYLSGDSAITTADTLQTTVSTPSLAAGGADNEFVANLASLFSGNAAPGTYYVGTLADYNGQVAESNEANNGVTGLPVILGDNNANTLTGTIGADTFFGLVGNDTYWVDNTGDRVNENAGEGEDKAFILVNGYALAPNVEWGTVATTAGLTVYGNGAVNILSGNSGGDTLYGMVGNDVLNSSGGDDLLDGGAGADSLAGGLGDDLYFVDNVADQIYENAGEGEDKAFILVNGYALAPNVEWGTVATTAGLTVYGNGAVNILSGNSGGDTLYGMAGNDVLNSSGGDDLLDGGAGADSLAGGLGDDLYFVDNVADQIYENAGEGEDKAFILVNGYALAPNVEWGTVATTAGLTVYGNGAVNILSGNSGGDTLYGMAGNDVLNSSGGDDLLDGGAGADSLAGGLGDDLYFVDNVADQIYENAGEGEDKAFILVNGYALAPNVEWGTVATTAGLTVYGNGAVNILSGNSGGDTLYGMAGNDVLNSSGGDDLLDGGAGTDELAGGVGNDTFVFRLGESAGDLIWDFNGNEAGEHDTLQFVGYGTSVQGATFTQVDATHWNINSADGQVHDVITLWNGASVNIGDYLFV